MSLLVDGLVTRLAVESIIKRPISVQIAHIAHAGGNQDLVVCRVYSLADGVNVVNTCSGQVGDTAPPDRLMKATCAPVSRFRRTAKLKEDMRAAWG